MLESNLFDECVGLIKEWVPKKKYPKEQDYRDDLMDFLDEELNKEDMLSGSENIVLRKEDGVRFCDIGVSRRVGIELKMGKHGKISRPEINRLQGQIEDFERYYKEGIIIVLVDGVNKYVERELREILQRKLDKQGILEDLRLKLINKLVIKEGTEDETDKRKGDGEIEKPEGENGEDPFGIQKWRDDIAKGMKDMGF